MSDNLNVFSTNIEEPEFHVQIRRTEGYCVVTLGVKPKNKEFPKSTEVTFFTRQSFEELIKIFPTAEVRWYESD